MLDKIFIEIQNWQSIHIKHTIKIFKWISWGAW